MLDLFGNHIVGFPTRWLKLVLYLGKDGMTIIVKVGVKVERNHQENMSVQ